MGKASRLIEFIDVENPSTPSSIIKSLNMAAKLHADHLKVWRNITSKFPDGTNIKGWEKVTIDGDIFWVKGGKKGVVDLVVEVGQKAIEKVLKERGLK
jgi:hypothetical protein